LPTGRITVSPQELIGAAGTLRSVQADLSAASGAHACGDLGSPELQAALSNLTEAVTQVAAALDGAVVAAALNTDAAANAYTLVDSTAMGGGR
jgi:hypothetical protein